MSRIGTPYTKPRDVALAVPFEDMNDEKEIMVIPRPRPRPTLASEKPRISNGTSPLGVVSDGEADVTGGTGGGVHADMRLLLSDMTA